MLKRIITAIAAAMMIANASACIADVGTAKTAVYVRDMKTGEIVGSLQKGDKVAISGKTGGWSKVCIGGKDYKVFSEYLDVSSESVDETETVQKVRKSKSAEKAKKNNGVKGKAKKAKIQGSAFEGVSFW